MRGASATAATARRRSEAEGLLKKAAEIDPTVSETYLLLGELYSRTGRNDEAAAMFREVLRWDPSDAGARLRLKELGASDKEDEKRGGLFRGLFKG